MLLACTYQTFKAERSLQTSFEASEKIKELTPQTVTPSATVELLA
jgi:hypothetical protein